MQEYVLNVNSPWVIDAREGDEAHKLLEESLNELDTAILGIVDTLDLPSEDLAAYLDQCLQSSYWQRRLQRGKPAHAIAITAGRIKICAGANTLATRFVEEQRATTWE